MSKKAYRVESSDPDEGCMLVYAETAGKAKSMVAGCFSDSYLFLYAYREKLADKYLPIAVNDELSWEREEHRKILEKEFGFYEL